MLRRSLSLILIILLLVSCTKDDSKEKETYQIEGIEYGGLVVAKGPNLRIFDFIFLHFYQEESLEETINKAYQYSCLYDHARKINPLTEEEKNQIISLAASYSADDIIYSDYSFENQIQYSLFMLMENTINKYKKEYFLSLEFDEEELARIYHEKIEEYKEISLQILFLPIKDKEEIRVKKLYLESKIKGVKSSEDMDILIREEVGDYSTTDGGKKSFVLKDYSEKEDEVYRFAGDPAIKVGDMALVTDEFGLYLLRCEDIQEYENNLQIREKVKSDYKEQKLYEKAEELAKEETYKLDQIDEDLLVILYEKGKNVRGEIGLP